MTAAMEVSHKKMAPNTISFMPKGACQKSLSVCFIVFRDDGCYWKDQQRMKIPPLCSVDLL